MTINAPQLQRTFQAALDAFLLDRRVAGAASGTLKFYRSKLRRSLAYLQTQAETVEQITPEMIRAFLLTISDDHTPGGVHAHYRTLKAFLRWYELEYEPTGWKNPIRKIKSPKVDLEPLEPVSDDALRALLATCGPRDKRDYAILLTLYDTGLRATELTSLHVEDVDLATGEIVVRRGKGGKPRTVFVGRRARQALRAVVRDRQAGPVFLSRYLGAMSYGALRDMVHRRARLADIEPPSLHSFRRAFALNCIRAKMDVFTLKRLMGHSSIAVLQRYVAQVNDDLKFAHAATSPGDRLLSGRTP